MDKFEYNQPDEKAIAEYAERGMGPDEIGIEAFEEIAKRDQFNGWFNEVALVRLHGEIGFETLSTNQVQQIVEQSLQIFSEKIDEPSQSYGITVRDILNWVVTSGALPEDDYTMHIRMWLNRPRRKTFDDKKLEFQANTRYLSTPAGRKLLAGYQRDEQAIQVDFKAAIPQKELRRDKVALENLFIIFISYLEQMEVAMDDQNEG
jgi:hypothetical protein